MVCCPTNLFHLHTEVRTDATKTGLQDIRHAMRYTPTAIFGDKDQMYM